MSASVNSIMQQLAGSVRVPRRKFFHFATAHCYGCHEPVTAACGGLLATKHSEALTKALSQDEHRKLLAELPTMTPRQRHDLLASIEGDLMHRTPEAKRRGAKP